MYITSINIYSAGFEFIKTDSNHNKLYNFIYRYNNYITNSYHVHVTEEIDAFEKEYKALQLSYLEKQEKIKIRTKLNAEKEVDALNKIKAALESNNLASSVELSDEEKEIRLRPFFIAKDISGIPLGIIYLKLIFGIEKRKIPSFQGDGI